MWLFQIKSMTHFAGNDCIYRHTHTKKGRITFFVWGVSQSLEVYAAHMVVAQTGFGAMPVHNSAIKYTTSRIHIKQKYLFNILSCPLFSSYVQIIVSRDSAVGIATSYWLDEQKSEFESRWGQEFSLLHVVQTGFGVHLTSYPMGTGGSFLGGKAAGAWSWPHTSY
jgi:hypothetical protein